MSTWIGWTVGMTGDAVGRCKTHLQRSYSYLKALDTSNSYLPADQALIIEWQTRVNADIAAGKRPGPVIPAVAVAVGAIDYASQVQAGSINPPPRIKPVMFTVEGHMSDMWAGPVSDTAAQLEREGLCRHQPVGYNSNALPFDNTSGVAELARLVGATTLDSGAPFPAGTPWSLGGFSQGGIVVSYFYFNYLQDGQQLAWRRKDLRGVLAYGNPCRQTDSIAPWARPWITKTGTHGLDPYKRFGLSGFPSIPDNWMDVYREGDIFAENGDDKASQIKAAVYEAVMSDFFSNPASLAAQIGDLFKTPMTEVIGIIMAIISGVSFLGHNPNPHYSPYDISGGINWMRQRLTAP